MGEMPLVFGLTDKIQNQSQIGSVSMNEIKCFVCCVVSVDFYGCFVFFFTFKFKQSLTFDFRMSCDQL